MLVATVFGGKMRMAEELSYLLKKALALPAGALAALFPPIFL